ncbi:MAG TPA: hypothetical protein ENF52_06510 [Chloroflexi bacterium]|nr:hypothetical protein [Chloroflexota bacterium]
MRERQERGQSMLELALVLPFLILLLVGTVEAGFALRDYLMTQSANREGVRFAVRTPPGEEYRDHFREEVVPEVFSRVLSAAEEGGLRPESIGVIVSYIYVDEDDDPAFEQFFFGVTHNSRVDVATLADENADRAAQINAVREANNMEPLPNELVVVEVFYDHHSLWFYDFIGPLGGPWTMYTQSSMRLVGTGRTSE